MKLLMSKKKIQGIIYIQNLNDCEDRENDDEDRDKLMMRFLCVTAKTESEKVNSLVSTMENLQLTPPGRTLDQEVPHHTRLKIWYATCQLKIFFSNTPPPL